MIKNKIKMTFPANSLNEALSRNVVASLSLSLNPTVEWLNDVKTAVSEAVTNCIVHAYSEDKTGEIELVAFVTDDELGVTIKDFGIGISDVEKAKEPFYTTKGEFERSGMGFTVMQTFMDTLEVFSAQNEGTTVHMTKKITRGGADA